MVLEQRTPRADEPGAEGNRDQPRLGHEVRRRSLRLGEHAEPVPHEPEAVETSSPREGGDEAGAPSEPTDREPDTDPEPERSEAERQEDAPERRHPLAEQQGGEHAGGRRTRAELDGAVDGDARDRPSGRHPLAREEVHANRLPAQLGAREERREALSRGPEG